MGLVQPTSAEPARIFRFGVANTADFKIDQQKRGIHLSLHTPCGVSHAKIILTGEHAVVYGQPAIALPLPAVTVTVTVVQNKNLTQPFIKSSFYTGPLSAAPAAFAGNTALINRFLTRYQAATGIELNIDSALPAERGMGSSAAVAVALTRALADYCGVTLTHQDLLDWVAIAEKQTHKNPSGVDAATCASTTPLWVKKGHSAVELTVNLAGYLVIVDTGVQGQTSEAIKAVATRLKEDPRQTTALLDQLGECSYSAKQALAKADLTGLATAFRTAQVALKELGVSHPALDSLIEVANAHESLGSKLTGGGRGGCFICLTKTARDAHTLGARLLDAGAAQFFIQPLSTKETGNE